MPRALTRRIRDGGAPTGVVAHSPEGKFDLDKLLMLAQGWPGLEGMDLAKTVTRERQSAWDAGIWHLGSGYDVSEHKRAADAAPHVVAVDYGAKDNIFRNLVKAGTRVTVVPAKTSLEEIVALREEIEKLEREGGQFEALVEKRKSLEQIILRSKRIPYIDPVDVRFRRLESNPKPIAKAVMFCLMDVSGSPVMLARRPT